MDTSIVVRSSRVHLALAIGSTFIANRKPLLKELGQFAHLFVAQWLVLGLPQFVQLGSQDAWLISTLLMAAAGFYLAASVLLNHRSAMVPALGCALLGMVHLFAWFEFALAYKMAACTGLGFMLIFAGQSLTPRHVSVGRALTGSGQVVYFISTLACLFLGMQTIFAHHPLSTLCWPIVISLLIGAALSVILYWSRTTAAGPLYLTSAIANVVLAGILLITLMEWPQWRKLELASIGIGLGLIVLGMRAWLREEMDHERQIAVSPLFLLGSLLVGVPVAIVVMQFRSGGQFMLMDEASMLVLGVLLLGAGCVCQLRIPAIAGATLTILYQAGLLLFVPWGHMGTASLVLAGGGAGLFLLGLVLSMFRDRLLALPQQVKERRGIFQVLGWR